uniref:Stress-induced protein n=1 Tax=Heterorhabditis bacteriophora TaxID=37862 RepID=A0A1I7XTH7_HETBA
MSSAEQMAAEFEQDGGPEFNGTTGKRSKAERVEHKHANPGGDTRKVVQIAQNGEAKRREHTQSK